MSKIITTSPDHSQDDPNNGSDQVVYRSKDGQFEVVIKTCGAWRKPAHNYPVVCLRLRPKCATRIQKLRDGTEGLDVLLTHLEVAEHLTALNYADPKGVYTFKEIPEKTAERKARWAAINQARWNKRHPGK